MEDLILFKRPAFAPKDSAWESILRPSALLRSEAISLSHGPVYLLRRLTRMTFGLTLKGNLHGFLAESAEIYETVLFKIGGLC